ncbi:flagellar hook-associated protein FlgL [Aeromonas schubertii]|uniref:Flagellar hook protein FlgL n=1 Tax=Aeromonas schubertii TaxID=652 RepID=A0A0S2SNH3_9GAMM|nr:flagellar hook-associated protein FlgL [Aeromonas schubertii]ALP43207.1 flagellar hook protein FlgL [Aeromonas schubertii]MBZ6071631.1 flagellar hook-associated protein FlgL [Aeromonas schubertii]QCG48656.1 flagellar hook-associated protein 3 [Aeromonas schubertii]
MRVTTNMIYNRNLSSLTSSNERLNNAYEQWQTGDKFKTAGQDPAGMNQKLELTNEIDLYKQYSINGGLLENSLSHEDTILDALNSTMMSARTLILKSNSGVLSQDDRNSIASELSGLQKQMFDLINTKNAQGDYIFGGNQSQKQPYVKDASGNYVFQGDTGQRFIQISPTVSIPANDNGLGIFESVPTRRTASSGSAGLSVKISDQGQFDNYYQQNYNPVGGNNFTLETTAGTPNTYQIKDGGGAVIQSGDLSAEGTVAFNGMELKVTGAIGGAPLGFGLDAPKNDNILNGMQSFIEALQDPTVVQDELLAKAADGLVHLDNARLRIDRAQGDVGARLNNLKQVMDSNSSLDVFNKTVRAKVSEADIYEVIAAIATEEAALSASQTAFSRIGRLTLFDYIR